MKIEGFEKFFGFEEFIVDKIAFSPEIVNITMHRDRRRKMPCPRCGHRMSPNKRIRRVAFDLPLGTALCVQVDFETWQGQCPRCTCTKTFLPDELDGKATATRRLKKFASELCPPKTVTEHDGERGVQHFAIF